MADSTNFSSLKDFWSPVGVSLITLYLGFVVTRINDYFQAKNKVKSERLAFIDFFRLELRKLLASFDILLKDLDDGPSFKYNNIGSANKAVTELKNRLWNIIIVPDESLRETIINIVDDASDVSIKLQALEDLVKQWNQEHQNTLSSVDYEENNLRLELMKLDVSLDNNLKCSPLGNKKINPKLTNYINQIAQRINEKRSSAFTNWTNSVNFAKDKRTILSTRILDTKTKLVELDSNLKDLREKTLSKKIHIF